MGKFFHKVGNVVNSFFAFWRKPNKGKYLTMKEATAYCVGGMGIVGGSIIVSYVTLGAGAYISVALGISVKDIWLIGIINSLFIIARSPLISMMIDNTRSKMGKFRPYIIWLTIPIILLYFAIGNIPFLFTDYTAKLVVFTIIFVLLTTCTTTHTQCFNSLIQVITPNTNERDGLMSIGAFVYSLGPSIVQLFFPIFAQLLYGSTALNEPAMFKVYLPIFVAVFYSLGFLAAFFTKERIVVSKKYKAKAKFWASVKKVSSNKYFWLYNSSTWLGSLKLIITGMVTWICLYVLNSAAALGLMATIMGTASVPGMLLAPWLIRKFGKKNLSIASNVAFIVFSIPMIFSLNNAYVMLVFIYLCNLVNGINVVAGPAMIADIYDYQQWRTGDRLEGFISTYGTMIGTAIGIGTTYIMPFIYEYIGFVQNADVLYDSAIRNPIFRWTLIVGMVSAALAVIPLLFYNLSEKKHDRIMQDLKQRAEEEDRLIEEQERLEREKEAITSSTTPII